MKLFVIDTETSDLDPSKGAVMLELAWIELSQIDSKWEATKHFTTFIQYDGPINPHAQAMHHIRTDQLTKVQGAWVRQDAVDWLLKHIETDSILVAHNMEFDSKFLPDVFKPWICTLRSARHIWPNAPGYSNQVLRYWLNVNPEQVATIGYLHPHRALYDAATTAAILLKMLEQYTPNQLLNLTRAPINLKKINFGKHKGMDFLDLPRDYLKWLQGRSDLDQDLKHTIESILRS